MELTKVLEIVKEREEEEFFYQICKQIAESDSIGESYGYCSSYDYKFHNHVETNDYIRYCGAPIYELYLKQIKYELV